MASGVDDEPDGFAATLADRGSQDRAPAPLGRGAALGRYLVLDVLGGGGMGVVYTAYDPELDRKLAIKLLRPSGSSDSDASIGRTRLLREAQAMARLQHPNVIAVHDVGTFEDQVFIAMEHVEGTTLTAWLEETPRSWREALAPLVEAGRGLAAAHAAGIVHRDFKPDNVLVGKDGRVRVLDFGLARAQEGAPDEPSPKRAFRAGSAPSALETPVTQTGALLGTPAYMPPEQLFGGTVDARSDQFSFCVALYEALYGERPFDGTKLVTLAGAVSEGRIRPAPAGSRVPAWLRQIVLRGLRVGAEDRWPSIEALLAALVREPQAARMRWLAACSTLLGLSAIGLGYRTAVKQRQSVCGGAESRLAGIWDDARKRVVQAAFAATGKSYAEPVFRSTSAALDRYTRTWIAMRTEACEATRVRAEQSGELLDLRMQCLDYRREELQALTEQFTRADAQMVEKASHAAEGLSPVEDCSRAAALRMPRAPILAAARAQVEVLRKQLAQAKALERSGKYDEGLRIAQAVSDAAAKLHYRPVQAEALVELGALQSLRGDYRQSEATLREAELAADASGDPHVEAKASVLLVSLVGDALSRVPEAREWVRRAEAALEHLGGDALLSAELSENMGLLLDREGNHKEELALHQRALGTFERVLGPGALETLSARDGLGRALDSLGRFAEATEHYQGTIVIAERALGPDHPRLAQIRNGLGNVLTHLGRHEEALAQYRRSLAIFEAALGPDHPLVAVALSNIGDQLSFLGRYEEARSALHRALAVDEKNFGPNHPDLAFELTSLGEAEQALRAPQRALPLLERALTLREHTQVDATDLADTRFVLAKVLWELGQQRSRAKALALQARAALVADGVRSRSTLGEVDTWLAGHAR
jgi:tetratricopeptide (TPR) repeat protein/predicted Ser/Thr protein kinase